MKPFKSQLNVNSDDFEKNHKDMLGLVEQLEELNQRAVAKSELSKARFEKRNQLLPRERLSRLLDRGKPFLELQSLAGYLIDEEDPATSVPGASVISGIGFVGGARCMIYADDGGIKAGSMTLSSAGKFLRTIEVALEKKLPFIHLVESAGANFMDYKIEMWLDAGGMFAGLAKLSAAGIPSIVVLHGPSAAGGAYMPGMSDYVIGVKENGKAYLAGPALLKAATGEVADDQELGGSEMHSSVSGLVEYLAEDDAHGIAIARDLMDRLEWNRHCPAKPEVQYQEPVYGADEILGLVPADFKSPYDVRELMARLVDGSDLLEFKPNYGSATVCVQAKVCGYPVGIIGNNGPIDPGGATKTSQFLQLCDQSDIPIVFLQNITGFMVGKEVEHAGMIKHGAKMIQAVTNIKVPRITFMIGASFGAGNYGMCGRAYHPDFLFTWPNAILGVVGGEQAAKTMTQVQTEAAERKGITLSQEALARQEQELIKHFDAQSSAFYVSGRLKDDGVIDPRDTRKILAFVLETCWESNNRKLHGNSFGVARA